MKNLNKTNESGRSMVEMLGVLAIIGVLSIGGIAGFTTAMKSYKANEIVNATAMCYMMGMAANEGTGGAILNYEPIPDGVTSITFKNDNTIEIAGIEDASLCTQVKNKLGDKVTTNGCDGQTPSIVVAMGGANEPEPLDNTGFYYTCYEESGELWRFEENSEYGILGKGILVLTCPNGCSENGCAYEWFPTLAMAKGCCAD